MKKRNILLVDDDKVMQELVTFYLEQSGFVVRIAPDGFSALSEIKVHHFDLVILDLSMPFMSGFKVLKSLREIPQYQNVPVIMLTSSGDKNDFDRVRDDVADYIIKPPKREDLVARVERVLGGRPQFEELKFSDTDPRAEASLMLPLRIVSLSHQGVVLSSPVPLEKDFLIEYLQARLFRQIGLSERRFRVIDCIEKSEKAYEFFISFLSLDTADQQRLHEWLMSQLFMKKEPS